MHRNRKKQKNNNEVVNYGYSHGYAWNMNVSVVRFSKQSSYFDYIYSCAKYAKKQKQFFVTTTPGNVDYSCMSTRRSCSPVKVCVVLFLVLIILQRGPQLSDYLAQSQLPYKADTNPFQLVTLPRDISKVYEQWQICTPITRFLELWTVRWSKKRDTSNHVALCVNSPIKINALAGNEQNTWHLGETASLAYFVVECLSVNCLIIVDCSRVYRHTIHLITQLHKES